MWSRKDFENTLAAVLKGDWLAHRKLIHYFNLENRSFKKADPEKEEQKRICFETTLQSANDGNAEANAFLGVLYRDGFGVEKNLKLSLQYIRVAHEKYHNTTGLYLLGLCNYWGVGLQKNPATGLELLRQAANLGHLGAAAELGSVLEAGDEKARWNSFAKEQGDPNALNASCHDEMCGNPFALYIPQNKDIKITSKELKDVDRVVDGKVIYNITGYAVTIEYTGPANIGERELIKKTLDYPFDQAYKDASPFAKYSKSQLCTVGTMSVVLAPISICICGVLFLCSGCSCHEIKNNSCKDHDDTTRIANIIASVSWERDLSEMIREADNLITKRLAQVGSGVANQGQFFRPGYQQAGANPNHPMPSAPQQYGENVPFLHDQKDPSAPPPYSPVVPIYKPLEIEQKERVVHVQGGASLRMSGSGK